MGSGYNSYGSRGGGYNPYSGGPAGGMTDGMYHSRGARSGRGYGYGGFGRGGGGYDRGGSGQFLGGRGWNNFFCYETKIRIAVFDLVLYLKKVLNCTSNFLVPVFMLECFCSNYTCASKC